MQCNICGLSEITLDKHHIQSVSEGGTNDNSNIADICPNCHRKVHSGLLVIEGWFLTTDGMKLLHHNIDEISITDRQPSCYTWRQNEF